MNLPCPECGEPMIQKPLKPKPAPLDGGFHFLCFGRSPYPHRVTLFWLRPADVAMPGESASRPDCKTEQAGDAPVARGEKKAPPAPASGRASSLLARLEKIK